MDLLMKMIKQNYQILRISPDILTTIELAGRTCYKSEDRITQDSAEKFVRLLRDLGHHAMLEFGQIIVKFITNRGVTHELVRHRLFSFAQESTRYVNYKNSEITFIEPVWVLESSSDALNSFIQACVDAEKKYKELIAWGWSPQQAREVLPNSLKSEIVVCGNPREWRHCLTLRTSKEAHPQMRKLMEPLLRDFKKLLPALFADL